MCKFLSTTAVRGARRTAMALWAAAILAVFAQAAETKNESGDDEAAIRAAVASYVAAYNSGDAKAVAAHWSESGEWTSPSGERFQGRQAIARELQNIFAANKGVKLEILHPVVRLVTADVATEEGTARVTQPGELPGDSTYLAIHVKKDGQWKLDSVHETSVVDTPAANPQLQDLAWLVGEWIDQSPDATMEANVSWTKNKAFLNYAFKVSAPGVDDMEGTQVIGWDAAAGVIRSWMFDSDGGIGEGVWSKKDNSWIVKFRQILPDGRQASATNIYTLVDGNTFTWKSIGRKLDGEFLPNIDEVKIVRKTAAAAAEAEAPKAAAEKQNDRKFKN